MRSRIFPKNVGGVTYEVDGKHVILRPTPQEKAVATALSKKYGKTVEFVPQIMFPQRIQTPDYLIDGEVVRVYARK